MSSDEKKLQVGDQAPDFVSKDEEGREIKLRDFFGKKIVLYFYPKDDTPGCTAQACNLRDNYLQLMHLGYVVLGVSRDDENSHKSFKEKYTLPFPLIADVDKKINEAYGVWVQKEKEGLTYWGTARTTFLIDEKGVITGIIDKVDTENHSQQVMEQ